MALSAVIGDSVRIGTTPFFQAVVTVTTGAGKQISDTFTYDGTIADITAQVKQRIAQYNAQGKIPSVPTGTVLDLTDPVVVPPATPPAGFDAWQTAINSFQRLKNLNTIAPSVTAQRVTDAKAAADALYQSAFEAFL